MFGYHGDRFQFLADSTPAFDTDVADLMARHPLRCRRPAVVDVVLEFGDLSRCRPTTRRAPPNWPSICNNVYYVSVFARPVPTVVRVDALFSYLDPIQYPALTTRLRPIEKVNERGSAVTEIDGGRRPSGERSPRPFTR